jgi:hypothetical protein
VFPPGHVAAGYLLYSLLRRLRGGRVPDDLLVVLALAVGTQMPDLIDKPLAYATTILPYGRSLGHSGVLTLVVLAAALVLARTYGPAPVAFAVGWASHLAADAVGIVIEGSWAHLWYYLGWPLFPLPEVEHHDGFIEYLLSLDATLLLSLELALVVLALALWIRDGRPGLRDLKRRVAAVA